MKTRQPTFEGLVIVDGDLASYERLLNDGVLCGKRVRRFSSGEDALREVAANSSSLWLVNIRLPDMSGITLLELIRRRLRQSRIIIAGDVYSPADELAARFAGATAYVCKPPSAHWFEAPTARRAAAAIRAGPPERQDAATS
jgi:DNA-binding response OmpR family regulator